MIRGCIEIAQRTRVSGWIYSSADSVRDKLIMAFVGPRCVGAGKVELFRKDLLEVGLGDGYCGFDFSLILNDGENLGAVVVKLNQADAALIQPGSQIISADDIAEDDAFELGALTPASVAWMLDRGWLDQPEYDFLKAIQNSGAYERGLRPPRRTGVDQRQPIDPGTMAADLLSIFMLADVDVAQATIMSLSDLAGDTSRTNRGAVSIVALWSQERGRLCVEERSHLGPKSQRGRVLMHAPSGGIDYSFGPDRLLFLHKHTSFSLYGQVTAGGITVFSATPRGTARRRPRLTEVTRQTIAA